MLKDKFPMGLSLGDTLPGTVIPLRQDSTAKFRTLTGVVDFAGTIPPTPNPNPMTIASKCFPADFDAIFTVEAKAGNSFTIFYNSSLRCTRVRYYDLSA